jgi:dienelactone hydrolase
VNDLEAALKQKSKSEFEIYRYDAHHAFMNEARPEVYDPASAKTAWERTLKFHENLSHKCVAPRKFRPVSEQTNSTTPAGSWS